MRRGALEKHPGHRGIILGEMDDRRQGFCSPDAGVAKVVRCHALYAEQSKTSPHAIMVLSVLHCPPLSRHRSGETWHDPVLTLPGSRSTLRATGSPAGSPCPLSRLRTGQGAKGTARTVLHTARRRWDYTQT
jgi:hypothetical protein